MALVGVAYVNKLAHHGPEDVVILRRFNLTSHRSRTWNILTRRINCTGMVFTCASALGILTVLGNPHG